MNVLEPAAMRAWEAREITAGRADPARLMRHAAGAAAAFLHSWLEAPRRLLLLAGKGHNGNDGLLMASLLRARGWSVQTLLSCPPASRKPAHDIPEITHEAARATIWPDLPPGPWHLPWTVVEALTGSGTHGPPRDEIADILRWLHTLPLPPATRHFSIDQPAGLGHDHPTFRAHATLALGAVPPACLRDAHRPWVGRIVPAPLPLDHPPEPDRFITLTVAARHLPQLRIDGHKRQRGQVALWAGSPGMAGAALLASRAALRGGAGLIHLWTHPDLVPNLATATPEIMVHPLSARDPLPQTLLQAPVILAGPGCGRDEHAALLLRRLGEETRAALVLDADALFLAAHDPSIFHQAGQRPIIATPHAGEWSRLLGTAPAERAEAAAALLLRHPGVTWVLKGPNTLVADSESLTWNATGNPGMASAGMGDVLAGLVAALLARGLHPGPAARLAVCWHSLAADLATTRIPEALLTASDVLHALPEAWRAIHNASLQSAST